ncbi:MAG: hypothetical protein ACREX4_23400, partial [Gammaproteobacteria bacterium]
GRLGLWEPPAAIRRGQGRSALSKFMRFQASGDTLNVHAALTSLPKDQVKAIMDAFLAVHPPKDHSAEIVKIEFYVDPDLNFDSAEQLQISTVTRNNLIDELLLMNESKGTAISGKLDLVEFLRRVWPLDTMPSTDPRFKTASGDVWQHMINNDDWGYRHLFDGYLNLLKETDDQFLRFLEQLVHPLVREMGERDTYLSVINRHLSKDGYKLEPYDQLSGYPIYKAVKTNIGVKQKVKNLIFAADGPKPEIVFSDSISNDIQIVKNAEHCLVYDLPIPETGLRWSDLVAWWVGLFGDESSNIEIERDLYRRLTRALSSEPEKLLFETYFARFRQKLGKSLPALIPQVYLHYDPYTLQQLRGINRLARQRMDFLMLFSNHERIVIEVDGKHHYANGDVASPQRYAEMVAADRELRLVRIPAIVNGDSG